jgi:hypothetical protein
MLTKGFIKHLSEKPDPYLRVWCFFYGESNASGVFETSIPFLLARFKISRTTLRRIISYGIVWTESGLKVDSKWTDNTLKIIVVTEFSGLKVDSKWTESGQITEKKDARKTTPKIEVTADIEVEINTTKKEKAQSDKLYPQMVDRYNTFCNKRIDMGAKMNAHQGKALKSIIEYLALQVKNKKGAITEDELKADVLNAWDYILNNWNQINGYYAEQIKLSQIDSNLPNILMQLRKNKKSNRDEKFANTYSEIGAINFD